MPNHTLHKLIPGHAYKKPDGSELVFLGYGSYRRYVPGDKNYNWQNTNRYLCMKKSDLAAKLADGRLSKDLKTFDGHATGKVGAVPDFFNTVQAENKPPMVITDLGEVFPADMFTCWTVEDHTFCPDVIIYWEVCADTIP